MFYVYHALNKTQYILPLQVKNKPHKGVRNVHFFLRLSAWLQTKYFHDFEDVQDILGGRNVRHIHDVQDISRCPECLSCPLFHRAWASASERIEQCQALPRGD
jgi:hypothetical protein